MIAAPDGNGLQVFVAPPPLDNVPGHLQTPAIHTLSTDRPARTPGWLKNAPPPRRGFFRSTLLALGLALLPAVAGADATDESASGATLDLDYAAGKTAIEARNWEGAIRSLSSAALRDTRNADIQNYLGYAYRQTGKLDLAFQHYEQALALNPRHRGAHEYIGEAYLMADDLARAQEHLGRLQQICLIPCEEYEDLEKAIAAYRKRTGR